MAPTQKEKFIAVAQEFLDNHQRLFDLYYVQGTITKEEHDQLHGLNWIQMDKVLLDAGVKPNVTLSSGTTLLEEVNATLLLLNKQENTDLWTSLGLKEVSSIVEETQIFETEPQS